MPERGAAQSSTSCTFGSPGCTDCDPKQVCAETRTGGCVCASAPSLASQVRQTAALVNATLVAGVYRMVCLLNIPPEPPIAPISAPPSITVPRFAWALFSNFMELANAGLINPPDPVKQLRSYHHSAAQAQHGAAQYAFDGPVDTRVTRARLSALVEGRQAALSGATELLLLVAAEASAVQAVDSCSLQPPEPVCPGPVH